MFFSTYDDSVDWDIEPFCNDCFSQYFNNEPPYNKWREKLIECGEARNPLAHGHSSYDNCWIEVNGVTYYIYVMDGKSCYGPYSSFEDAMEKFRFFLWLIYRYIFTYYNRERVYTTNPEGLPPDVLRERYYKKEVAA